MADAKKYKTPGGWRDNSIKAYDAAWRHDWLDQCCAHMKAKPRTRFWTLEKCMADAKKYNGRYEWRRKSRKAHKAARRHHWLDQCCAHMEKKKTDRKSKNSLPESN